LNTRSSLSLVWTVLAIIAFGWSCQERQLQEAPVMKQYYDLDSVLEYQITWLDSLKPQVKKLVILDGQEEERIDTVRWDRELIFFEESDINRPFLRGSYDAQEITENGFRKIVYSPKDPSDLGVVRLAVYLKSGYLQKIECVFEERNLLYTNSRIATMSFSEVGGIPRLTNYQLEGRQKVILKDPIEYLVKGEVLYL